jgi:uncharacterized protein (DUF3820 family)
MPNEENEERKPFIPEKVEEIGRIEREKSSDIVIRKSLYKGRIWIDIRHYLKLEKFTGFSRKGLALPEENLDELIELLQKAKNTELK